jgi:hypothetical protein
MRHRGPLRHTALSLTLALDGDGWLMPCPGHLNPRNDLVPTVREVGWDPVPIWKGVKKPAYTRIQSLDVPASARSHTNYAT